MKRNLLSFIMCVLSVLAYAEKALYIPNEWKNPWQRDTLLYSETDEANQYTWSKSRSKESANFIVYWDKYYGNMSPSNASYDYKIDIDDLLDKAEWFYSLNVGELAFCDEANSNVSKYKMMILLNHTTEWICYGGGYDDVIGALWLSPSTCKPVGFAVAHEVGHSFQYQTYADLKGFAGFRTAIGSGSTFWEQTAQWQAAQAFPEQKWQESWNLYKNAHNLAMTHEHYRYQSYWWHYYLTEKYGIDFIGKLWRHDAGKGIDPNEVLMAKEGMSVEEFYRMYFDFAMKMATVDLDEARDEASPYIGSLRYDYIPLGGTKHQVSYSSCPQSTGFNVIPLNVPVAGTKISTSFTSLRNGAPLAEGDSRKYFDGEKFADVATSTYNKVDGYSARGFRLGYVALMKDGSRKYMYDDEVYCAGVSENEDASAEVGCVVPSGVQRLFLVVVPTPSSYFRHLWDEKPLNDDQWAYTVEFSGTNILGASNIIEGAPIEDVELAYDVYFPANAATYPAITIPLLGNGATEVGSAFQMQMSSLASVMDAWSANGAAEARAMFYGVNADGTLANSGSTANGYGHWFDSNGNVSAYASGYVYSEFDASALSFTLGQYPGKVGNGDEYVIRQAICYRKEGKTALAKFVFNVHIDAERTDYEVKSINGESLSTKTNTIVCEDGVFVVGIYSVSGVRLNSLHRGVNLILWSDGRVEKRVVAR